jgi:hypothetical protein
MKGWEIALIILAVAGVGAITVVYLHENNTTIAQPSLSSLIVPTNTTAAIQAGNTAQILNSLGAAAQGVANSGLFS